MNGVQVKDSGASNRPQLGILLGPKGGMVIVATHWDRMGESSVIAVTIAAIAAILDSVSDGRRSVRPELAYTR